MTANAAYKTVGQRSKFRATFRDLDGDLFDPPVVLVKIKEPDVAEVTYQFGVDAAVVRESEGVYLYEQPWTINGTWHVRMVGMTDLDDIDSTLTAYERSITVRKSAFTTPIV